MVSSSRKDRKTISLEHHGYVNMRQGLRYVVSRLGDTVVEACVLGCQPGSTVVEPCCLVYQLGSAAVGARIHVYQQGRHVVEPYVPV